MKCKNCNNQLNKEDVFCPECGRKNCEREVIIPFFVVPLVLLVVLGALSFIYFNWYSEKISPIFKDKEAHALKQDKELYEKNKKIDMSMVSIYDLKSDLLYSISKGFEVSEVVTENDLTKEEIKSGIDSYVTATILDYPSAKITIIHTKNKEIAREKIINAVLKYKPEYYSPIVLNGRKMIMFKKEDRVAHIMDIKDYFFIFESKDENSETSDTIMDALSMFSNKYEG